MNIFSELKEELNLENDKFEKIYPHLLEIEDKLVKEKLDFDKQQKLAFFSHMVSFIDRLMKGEKTKNIDKKITSELSDYSISLAKEIIVPLFEKYQKEVDFSEIILVAIHLENVI